MIRKNLFDNHSKENFGAVFRKHKVSPFFIALWKLTDATAQCIGDLMLNTHNYFTLAPMWTCPKCNRNFKGQNQSHMCTTAPIDDLFLKKPESLLLAFDKILIGVIDWDPCTVGRSVNTVVFTKEKAWLIVRPMSKLLDVKFYYPEIIQSPLVFKTELWKDRYAHHLRISSEQEVTTDFLQLLRRGFDAS